MGIYSFAQNQNPDRDYCKQIEQDIRSNQSFQGIVTCYAPATEGFNRTLDSKIENMTDLQCICRTELNGEEKIFEIRKSKSTSVVS